MLARRGAGHGYSRWGRVALLSNPASVESLEHKESLVVFKALFGDALKALMGPQHGYYSTLQDNMIETPHEVHSVAGLPIYSLYSETREPKPYMLEEVDTIVVDLQLSGCRVYTFKYTMAACLRAAKKLGKRVVVLDRPNPVNGITCEGRVLDVQNTRSFVGEYALPLRHGLTIAELALLFNRDIGADLEVVEMKDWNPFKCWQATDRTWIPTSPNLPTLDSVLLYPATVMLEGTNISEGRGTGLPFQLIGAPYIKRPEVFKELVIKEMDNDTEGVFLRPTFFMPTFHKGKGQTCGGLHLMVEPGAERVKTFSLGLAIIKACAELGGEEFSWANPPYEYESERAPIDLILGTKNAASEILERPVTDDFWFSGISRFEKDRQDVLLYSR